ncbi:MAG TPA: T9SS type A sorting domain-containing protein [Flavipsychrobacter sp.]|nr:T9SS type A sorting domain-containing protein [Flavipsychrobacter sp.]
MKKAYLTLLLGLSSLIGYSQISGPDTVCLNTNVTFSTTYNAESYAWAIGDVPSDASGVTATNITSNTSYLPSGVSLQYDNGNYYGFVTQRHGGLLRLDFGSSLGSPTIVDLGNFGGSLDDSTLGLDIVKDASSNWHGYSVDGKNLIHFYWGSSLGNVPTVNTMAFNSSFYWPYSITLKKSGNEWVAFVVNRAFSSIVRLEFGTNLSGTPSATTLTPSGGFLNAPINIALQQQAGTWYALITNIGSGGGPGGGDKLVRWNFGTNIKNNSPTHTDLGNPSNLFRNPRALAIISNCDTTFALTANENDRKLIKIDFVGGVITGAPSATDLGTLSVNSQTSEFSTIWYGNKLAMLGCSLDSAIVLYDNVMTLPATSSTLNFSNSNFSKSMSVGGIYDITVFCNQGSRSGSAAFCKTLNVLGNIKVAIKLQSDTLVATGTLCDNYVWKFNGVVIPGANTQKHYPVEGTGVYTCTGNTAGCAATSNYMYFSTGVENVLNTNNIIISPNPTTGVFNVNMKGIDGKVTVQCYNVMGSLVATQTIDASAVGSVATIDLSNMAKGVYQVKIQAADGGNIVKQIVLQ